VTGVEAGTLVVCVVGGAAFGAVGMYAVAFSLRKKSEAESLQEREALKGHFATVSAEVFKAATDQFLSLAQSRLETEQVRAGGELDERRRAVEAAVGQLAQKLGTYEELMRQFEGDRTKKYGSLEEQLRRTAQTTDELRQTAEGLRAALSNPRARGQWGERMADDILRTAGLLENVQYLKNRAQETTATRPDFTFLLPDGHKLNMDVKFPLDNYLRMVNAGAEEEAARHKAEFLRDVKARIKELQKREYINPEENTLDYVLLFIPNERIYAFMLESAPGIVDEALAQKVVLASPFSLYAVLAIVRQSFENFHFAQTTQEVVKLISAFASAYEKFKERFLRLGEQLDRTAQVYQEIAGPSVKRLDQAIARIESARRGAEGAPAEDAGVPDRA
jgi:DNA recombination protein RmuC